MASFPILFVTYLGAPVHLYGFAEALNYGVGMGYLPAGRSIGAFVGNTVMGLPYGIGYFYAYVFASIMSLTSFLLIPSLVLRS